MTIRERNARQDRELRLAYWRDLAVVGVLGLVLAGLVGFGAWAWVSEWNAFQAHTFIAKGVQL